MNRKIRLDSSSLEYSSCLRRFQFVNRIGLVPKISSAALDWGSAFHKAAAEWEISKVRGSIDTVAIIDRAVEWYNSRMCLKDEPRSGPNLRRALEEYFLEYADDEFVPLTLESGEVAVELPFEIPLVTVGDTDVVLCGKMDGIGFYGKDGSIVVKDIKTSTSTKVESHLEEQLHRPQFHIYVEVLRRLGLVDVGGRALRVVIDGVYISKQFQGAKLRRSPPTVIEDFIIERTMEHVMGEAWRIAQLDDASPWPHNYGACHGKYSICPFYDICSVPTASQGAAIDFLFAKREYNPATFDE